MTIGRYRQFSTVQQTFFTLDRSCFSVVRCVGCDNGDASTPSGEELLIDYGSAAKGMYRFARTYGFVHFGYTNGERKQDERRGTGNGPSLEPGATSSKDSLRLELPAPSPPLIVPVRLADVAAAPPYCVGAGGSPRGTSAPLGTQAAAEAAACEERLRRYPTSAEEDLRLLRRLSSEACAVSEEGGKEEAEDKRRGPRQADAAKSAGSPATRGVAVTAEWVKTCVALRAAEKIALERELSGRTKNTPLD